ncbi:YkgJ family cysteine cluster protein [Arcobacter sp. LA11]|uniref:YkgJ family cysteine cluster protein n=1 Tax=Arcobacter sp. LA11 TaxID=1898176 RepID=UPI0009333159|nr:YkgJ family cysteine cluster protein [Arcobacter sp. LA11]
MKEFISTNNHHFTFGNCSNCEAKCCDGRHGTIFSQIILNEFEKVYKNFPILFIFGELGFIKPIILLTTGNDFCPYLKDFKCTIYQDRPTVCRTYPLSPNLDNNIYIDTLCPEINKSELTIIKNNTINENFDNSVFYEYQDKYIETHFQFEKLEKKDFEKIRTINKVDFFKYVGTSKSKYLEMHKSSLKNLSIF